MTGPSQDKDSSVGTPVPKQKSKATIDTLGVGCIAMVQKALKMQVYHKGEHKMVLPTALIKRHEAMREKQKLKPKRVIDPSRIVWKPFKLVDRTWGW